MKKRNAAYTLKKVINSPYDVEVSTCPPLLYTSPLKVLSEAGSILLLV